MDKIGASRQIAFNIHYINKMSSCFVQELILFIPQTIVFLAVLQISKKLVITRAVNPQIT